MSKRKIVHLNLGFRSKLPQIEVRRAIPVDQTLRAATTAPTRTVVRVSKESWSNLVVVPEGYRATLSFSVGRLRIERNGALFGGIWYRRPSLETERQDPDAIVGRVSPFAMLDKTPRFLTFDPTTRSLRFLSLESKSEVVVVDFSP